MNMKRAFTLIELLVYMMMLGFVIVVAGRVFSDSAIMRIRSLNMIKNIEEIGRVSNLIKEDISQMGVKAWGQEDAAQEYYVYSIGADNPKIYWNATGDDFSSYALFHRPEANGIFFDSIVFRKAAFDDYGQFLGIREIAWAARESTRQLVRRCATVQKVCPPAPAVCGATDTDLDACPPVTTNVDDVKIVPIVIADSIANFKIVPGVGISANPQEDTLFGFSVNPKFKLLSMPENGNIKATATINAGVETTLFDFAQNPSKNDKFHNELYLAEESGISFSNCKQMNFKKGETYAIEFKMPFSIPSGNSQELQQVLNSTQFVPGRDHLAIGLRTNTGATIPDAPLDILFYPPQSGNATELSRRLEFSVSADVNACLAITIAYYSPSTIGFNAANGILKFSDFKVFRKPETFRFPKAGDADYNPNYGAETGITTSTKIREKINAKAFEFELEIKNNRNVMLITTPNNGGAL